MSCLAGVGGNISGFLASANGADLVIALDLGFKKLSAVTGLAWKFDKYAKPATGWVFIAAGVYLGLRDIFGLF